MLDLSSGKARGCTLKTKAKMAEKGRADVLNRHEGEIGHQVNITSLGGSVIAKKTGLKIGMQSARREIFPILIWISYPFIGKQLAVVLWEHKSLIVGFAMNSSDKQECQPRTQFCTV
jgi:hypothetical protein